MKKVTLIPARGGSKGITRKNLIDIHGKPLIYYTIVASLDSSVHETWISTEDDEIFDVAQDIGAQVIRRPKDLATDEASSESVLLHFASKIEFDTLVFLQATSPMTTSDDINNGLELMENYNSVIGVTSISQNVWIDKSPTYDIYRRRRRQDKEKVYIETGSIFITSREELLRTKNRISGEIGFVEIPNSRSFEIDTYDDLELVRKLMK